MPKFITYDIEYTNIKPFGKCSLGSGKVRLSIPEGSKSIKAKLKRMVERKINSLGVRIDNFVEVSEKA